MICRISTVSNKYFPKKDQEGRFFRKNYSFPTASAIPVKYTSSPKIDNPWAR